MAWEAFRLLPPQKTGGGPVRREFEPLLRALPGERLFLREQPEAEPGQSSGGDGACQKQGQQLARRPEPIEYGRVSRIIGIMVGLKSRFCQDTV